MAFRFFVNIHSYHLISAPVKGRRTFYASVTLGSRTFWLQRWDTARCSGSIRSTSRDGLMCWQTGKRVQA